MARQDHVEVAECQVCLLLQQISKRRRGCQDQFLLVNNSAISIHILNIIRVDVDTGKRAGAYYTDYTLKRKP